MIKTTDNKSVWKMRLATLCIFLLGFIAGGAALNVFYMASGAGKSLTKQERYEEAFEQLNLDAAQKSAVQKIVFELRGKIQLLRQSSEPQLQIIRTQNDEKLREVLTPEQWNKFQELREVIRQENK